MPQYSVTEKETEVKSSKGTDFLKGLLCSTMNTRDPTGNLAVTQMMTCSGKHPHLGLESKDASGTSYQDWKSQSLTIKHFDDDAGPARGHSMGRRWRCISRMSVTVRAMATSEGQWTMCKNLTSALPLGRR